MSGSSPQTANVGIGTFPGCLETPMGGGPGIESWYTPSTTDANGCSNEDGSPLSLDNINGLNQAVNCVLTQNGLEPLPLECLCENPCLLYDAIVSIADICRYPDATVAQKEDFEDNPENYKVPVCGPTGMFLVTADCLGTGIIAQTDDCEVDITAPGQWTVTQGPVYVSLTSGGGLCGGGSGGSNLEWRVYQTGDSGSIAPNQNAIQATGGTVIPNPSTGVALKGSTCIDSESGQGLQENGTATFYCGVI